VYGGLNPQAQAAVEEHLVNCPQCADRVKTLEREKASLRQFVAGLDAGMVERLDRVRRRLQAEPSVERAREPGLWKRFIQSRVARLGVAAAILLAGLTLLVHLGDGSIGLSNTALARVAEAMNNVPWVHLQDTMVMDGRTRHFESWLSNPLQISAGREVGGPVTWYEVAARRRATCDPAGNRIVISYAPRTSTSDVIDPSYPIDVFRKQHDGGDTKVTCTRGQRDGIDVDIYEAVEYARHDAQHYLRSRHKLIADRKRHLILISEQYYYNLDGTLINSNKSTWDYPQDGPKSIYDVGAPKSARVLDFSPSSELLQVLDNFEANRDSFPARYIAIVEHSQYDTAAKSYAVDGLDVFHSNNDFKRVDGVRFQPVDQKEFAVRCGESFETLMSWWEHRESNSVAVEWQSVALCDEEYAYLTSMAAGGPWRPLQKSYKPAEKDRQLRLFGRQSPIYGDPLAEMAYPMRLVGRYYREPTKISFLQDDYARDNACICLELLYDGETEPGASGDRTSVILPERRLFYLDPNRDYFCRREEVRYDIDATWPVDPNWLDRVSQGDLQHCDVFLDTTGQQPDVVHGVRRAVVVRDVPEYDRTDSGRWYPKTITMDCHAERYDGTVIDRKSMMTILLSANPTFPEGTFDPSRLPK
jgi:hypothetical protein